MSLLERYQDSLQKQGFVDDPAQRHALTHFAALLKELAGQQSHEGFFSRLFGRHKPIRGTYLWGGVGRGKTFLMDLFFEEATIAAKQRVHFHKFMLDVHEQLDHLPKSPDPLVIIARKIADKVKLLCLDEFHVHDVADAMILVGLLSALFKEGVILVATSNTAIDTLYLNGLQRERFLQVIALLQQHTREIELLSPVDYRLSHLASGRTYCLCDEVSSGWLRTRFQELAPTLVTYAGDILINHRQIKIQGMSDDVLWCDFEQLCETPRSASDYLEIARRFHTLLLSDIPLLPEARDSEAKRFMHLIDALYDHRVKLLATAQAEPAALYSGLRLAGSFERTVSRLIEMASQEYLALPHRL